MRGGGGTRTEVMAWERDGEAEAEAEGEAEGDFMANRELGLSPGGTEMTAFSGLSRWVSDDATDWDWKPEGKAQFRRKRQSTALQALSILCRHIYLPVTPSRHVPKDRESKWRSKTRNE